MTKEQKRVMHDLIYTCKVCGKLMPDWFQGCRKTTLYYENDKGFGMRTMYVCCDECKDKWEEKDFVEEYKGHKIYCVNGKYIPYYGSLLLKIAKRELIHPILQYYQYYNFINIYTGV